MLSLKSSKTCCLNKILSVVAASRQHQAPVERPRPAHRGKHDEPGDGVIALSSSVAFSFDPNHRAQPGAYDGIGALEHEIGHILGRVSLLGAQDGSQAVYSLLDLHRYLANGAQDLGATTGAYDSTQEPQAP